MIRLWDSVVGRLIAITVLVGLVTGVVGVLLLRAVERRDLRAELLARNLAAAERTATILDGRIAGLQDQMALLASQPVIAGLGEHAQTELAVALRVSDEMDRLVLVDRAGSPRAAAASSELLTVGELPERPELARAVAEGPTEGITPLDGFPQLELGVPVEDPPGTFAGALVAHIPIALLVEKAETRLLSRDTTGFLVSDDGTIIDHREIDRVLRGDTFPLAEIFPDGQRVATVEDDGETLLLAAARSDVLPVWFVVEQPEAGALAAVESETSGATWVFVAVVVSIVGAVLLTGRRLLRPLRSLATATERLGAGDHQVRVGATGVGEVGVLADGFNRMANALQTRQEELVAAEVAARESEQRLRLMIEGVTDYAILFLDLDGTVRTWNSGARRLLGYEKDQAVGRRLRDFFDPDDPPDDPLLGIEETGRSEIEGWCRRADGSTFWGHIAVGTLEDEDGRFTGYAVVLHDLTDRQKARRAIEQALAREQEASESLRRANRLKDEFLAVAAHELNTPLAAILGSVDLLQDWENLDAVEIERFRAMIKEHAQNMRTIVRRLLDFVRLQAGKVRVNPEELDIRAELTRYVELLEQQLADHHVELDAPDVEIRTDAEALRHVMSNLLSNAAKYSPAGSTISIRAQVADGQLVVSVRDEGIGIPEDDREHIFDLFVQARSSEVIGGTGVGLAIVKRYTELLGGDVGFDSVVGRGSIFTVRVPVGTNGELEPTQL